VKTAIVGAGISGLATGHEIRKRDPDRELVVYEAGERSDGKVLTEPTEEGYLCEWGVNAFLDKSPQSLEQCEEVGLSPVRANEASKKRYVFSEGELHKLPESPPESFTSKLLSLPGRLRTIEEEVRQFPGLMLTGNGYRGVSLNDCVVNARKTAESLLPPPPPAGALSSVA
jgi:oxygen-dependent protoporphyrinogen oxidase